MTDQPSTFGLGLALVFLLLGPIAASAARGTWSAPLMALSWAIAVTVLVVTIRRTSRPGGRGDARAERRDGTDT